MGIYDNIRLLCRDKGRKISELETELGFPRSSIAKWNENIPSVLKVKKVADYFGVTMEELLSQKEPEKEKVG